MLLYCLTADNFSFIIRNIDPLFYTYTDFTTIWRCKTNLCIVAIFYYAKKNLHQAYEKLLKVYCHYAIQEHQCQKRFTKLCAGDIDLNDTPRSERKTKNWWRQNKGINWVTPAVHRTQDFRSIEHHDHSTIHDHEKYTIHKQAQYLIIYKLKEV